MNRAIGRAIKVTTEAMDGHRKSSTVVVIATMLVIASMGGILAMVTTRGMINREETANIIAVCREE